MMPSKLLSCVIGIDVGGTNTDAVVLRENNVVAWHKTPTTPDIQAGVEEAIQAVMKKADLPATSVNSVKIGTTQFVNAVLEQDSSKLDKVAVIRLCGPYSRGSPPFVDFPPTLRTLMEGHHGYVDGGYQVDGSTILDLNREQLQEQAAIIKAKSISSIVVIGVYSPSNPKQEEDARAILAAELGPGFDISCSYAIGKLGFLERENASILNASLRRFARHVIAGFAYAVHKLSRCKLYITLNDGTLSTATAAAEHPVRCISSGPTNSARGAALLAKGAESQDGDNREVLVVDVGGTTTDICCLLKSGYPRQSAAFVKIAGVRTNFTIPDVRSIAIGGGSYVRISEQGRTLVGPDSAGSQLEQEGIHFGGNTLTATDLAIRDSRTIAHVSEEVRNSGLREIERVVEKAIDLVKTKQGDAKVILVGGGSIIIGSTIAGVGEVVRPRYLEVANAVGAAIGKISGSVDTVVVPGAKTIDQEIEDAKSIAIDRCVASGGDIKTIEVVEIEVVPVSYVTNGATRVLVRVVGDLLEEYDDSNEPTETQYRRDEFRKPLMDDILINGKGSTYEVEEKTNLHDYRPRIEGDTWYLSETDLNFLVDGTGVLGVGSCGEPYPTYLACLIALREGKDIKIMNQHTIADDSVILAAGLMGSPSVYLERIPGLDEVAQSMNCVMKAAGLKTFDCVIPNEIGGLNAFEALLAGCRFGRSTLDTDCVARAYPKVWQTVRCLKDVPIAPSAVTDGCGKQEIFSTADDNLDAEDKMRDACTDQGSLAGMCVNPMTGAEAKALPQNSFSYAWNIGRTIALARSQKKDIVHALLEAENGVQLFSGKIISVTRKVAEGFTRGSVTLEQICDGGQKTAVPTSLLVDFENENLVAIEKVEGREDRVLACCPDLITFLDMANGAPLGISDYKYGLRVNVIALPAPPVWTTEKGLEMGGPQAFDLDMAYQGVSIGTYKAPRSVFEMFGSST
ncbi:hydantoinase [Phlyctema vagabunda]|uniref:Hydantoinase n=1 Tax=Phlyctema vagabunda TaxID=108571 RepID=A0ABR4PCD4_9HELO